MNKFQEWHFNMLAEQINEDISCALSESIDIDESAATAVVDFTIKAPLARKSQKKVNKMFMKIVNLESTVRDAEGDKKAKLKEIVSNLKSKAAEYQSAVTDKYASSSNIIKKALNSEKIKGKLDALKASMGEGDNSKIKDQLGKLQNRLRAEEQAYKELNPDKKSEPKEEDVKEDVKINESISQDIRNLKSELLTRCENLGLTELHTQISEKEDWQLNNTPLYENYNRIIKLQESNNFLNENKHNIFSIKDKFKALM